MCMDDIVMEKVRNPKEGDTIKVEYVDTDCPTEKEHCLIFRDGIWRLDVECPYAGVVLSENLAYIRHDIDVEDMIKLLVDDVGKGSGFIEPTVLNFNTSKVSFSDTESIWDSTRYIRLFEAIQKNPKYLKQFCRVVLLGDTNSQYIIGCYDYPGTFASRAQFLSFVDDRAEQLNAEVVRTYIAAAVYLTEEQMTRYLKKIIEREYMENECPYEFPPELG